MFEKGSLCACASYGLDERIVFRFHTEAKKKKKNMHSSQTGSLTQLAFCSIGTGSKSSLDVDLATDIRLVPS
jgi:hypothetical protein